jgi:putative protein kinase ArgK-like GTPase of G3E family
MNWQKLLQQIYSDDIKALARAMSLVENGCKEGTKSLLQLPPNLNTTKTIGITGYPEPAKAHWLMHCLDYR